MTLLDDFRSRYAGADFPHQAELWGGLLRGDWSLRSAPDTAATNLTCSHYLRICQVRERLLRRFSTAHAQRVRADVLSLCRELALNPEEPVLLWMFASPPYHDLAVFEGAMSRRILGCIAGVDARLVSPEEWTTLRGE